MYKYYEMIPANSGYPKHCIKLSETECPKEWAENHLDLSGEYSIIESPHIACMFD